MVTTTKKTLGQILLQAGKIDEEQLQKALDIQKEKDVYLGVIFRELGFMDEQELNKYISRNGHTTGIRADIMRPRAVKRPSNKYLILTHR